MSAVRFAILIGTDAIEIDVRHTKDDRLVVMHDGSAKRTTGVDQEISEMTLEEVMALPLLAEGYLGEFGCERPMAFETLLALAKDRIDIDVDTKTSRGDLVALAIRDAGMIDQASVSVSSINTALSARMAVPEIKLQLRPDTVEEYEQMRAMLARPPEILEVPDTALQDFAAIAQQIDAKLFVNVFIQDVMVFGDGNLDVYETPFSNGANIVQSEFPMWMLVHLGRDYWDALPAPRDLGLDSPKLRE